MALHAKHHKLVSLSHRRLRAVQGVRVRLDARALHCMPNGRSDGSTNGEADHRNPDDEPDCSADGHPIACADSFAYERLRERVERWK